MSSTGGNGEIRRLQRRWAERIGTRLMYLHTKNTIMGPIFPKERCTAQVSDWNEWTIQQPLALTLVYISLYLWIFKPFPCKWAFPSSIFIQHIQWLGNMRWNHIFMNSFESEVQKSALSCTQTDSFLLQGLPRTHEDHTTPNCRIWVLRICRLL